MPIFDRSSRLRLRRVFRRRRRQVEDISEVADAHLDKHLFRRLIRLIEVRRFIFSWLGLVLLLVIGVIIQIRALDAHYKTPQPTSGGNYVEGVIGSFTNANPLYATGSVDSAVSRLVFAGLLKYDENSQLVPDLAESWSVDAKATTYTVKLKPNLTWHDGQPLTADDVAFTYTLIQNPDAKSYLQTNWRDIKVEKLDDMTVRFVLPNKFTAFPHSLTNGIVPKHKLEGVAADQLRSSRFNTVEPIGAGPFRFDEVQVEGESEKREERVGVTAFEGYNAGQPKIAQFVIKTFKTEEQMIKEYENQQINAMVGLAALPDQFSTDIATKEYDPKLLGEVMVFFKTSEAPLGDVSVRRALVLAVNKQKVLSRVPYPLLPIAGPLLSSHVGYSKTLVQASSNKKKAEDILDKAGWKVSKKTGLRTKNGKPLQFTLISRTNSEYSAVIQGLQKQWQEIGVDAQVVLQQEQELQSSVAQHSYDALLYAISIGPDPDVFAYWHSSQADPRSLTRLNFSEYQSAAASEALEAGRTRATNKVRSVKYRAFLKEWQKDVPALALYQPRFLYIVRSPFYGFEVNSVVSAADRYAKVENWAVRTENRYQ